MVMWGKKTVLCRILTVLLALSFASSNVVVAAERATSVSLAAPSRVDGICRVANGQVVVTLPQTSLSPDLGIPVLESLLATCLSKDVSLTSTDIRALIQTHLKYFIDAGSFTNIRLNDITIENGEIFLPADPALNLGKGLRFFRLKGGASSDNVKTIEITDGTIGVAIIPFEKSENPAKMKGKIGHRPTPEDSYSVNEALEKAFAANSAEDITNDARMRVGAYLAEANVAKMLRGIADVSKLQAVAKQASFVLARNPENDSPTLVMKDMKNYQVAHVGLSKRAVYLSSVLADQLSARPDLMNALMVRELVLLSRLLEVYNGSNYDEAVADAEALAERAEKALAGDDLDMVIHDKVSDFIDSLEKKVANSYVAWDYDTHLFPEEAGKPIVGGKSYQIAVMRAEDPTKNFRSFSGTAKACIDFLLADKKLLPSIYDIVRNIDTADERERTRAYEHIRKMVLEAAIPQEIAEALKQSYLTLCEQEGYAPNELLVAVRSSGRAEDISLNIPELEGVSLGANAGQHDSYLAVKGADEVVWRWKCCVASLFTDRVLDYRDGMMVYTAFGKILPDKKLWNDIYTTLEASRNPVDQLVGRALRTRDIKIISSMKLRDALKRNGFDQAAEWVEGAREHYIDIGGIAMGVTIMPMADAQQSFVNFGAELTAGWTAMTFQEISVSEHKNKGRVFTVTSTWGLGESIVQGAATPDAYLVHVFDDENGRHANILSRQLGTKMVQAIYTKTAMDQLGLTEDDLTSLINMCVNFEADDSVLREAHEFLSTDAGMRLFKANAHIETVIDVLRKLYAVKPDKTASVAIDKTALGMFTIDRAKLDRLAHLLRGRIADSKARTIFTDVPEELRYVFAATDSQIEMIALDICMKAAEGYNHAIDVEGAVGLNLGKDNTAVLLQRRPSNDRVDVDEPGVINLEYTYLRESDIKAVQANNAKINEVISTGDLLCEGTPTRNAFSGTTFKINEEEELPPQFEEAKKYADKGEIIIRCQETSPDFIPVLKYPNVRGVIADDGGATSHAAVVSRELGIATVVGIRNWLSKLEERVGPLKAAAIRKYLSETGSVVTVDANANDDTGLGRVFAGQIPISKMKIRIDIKRLPYIYTKIAYIMGMPNPMLAMSKIAQYGGYYGVALMRAEFVYAEENVNPRAGVAYDHMLIYDYLRTHSEKGGYEGAYFRSLSQQEQRALKKFTSELDRRQVLRNAGIGIPYSQAEDFINTYKSLATPAEAFLNGISKYTSADVASLRMYTDEIRKLTDRLEGYLSYGEFFNAVHGGAVATMAAANSRDKNTVIYRSIDFKKNEARKLIGSIVFDPEPEPATMIGERGARWMLQPENQVILREEIRMLLRQVDRGYTNLGFMFPFVAKPQELNQLLQILEDEERAMSAQLGRPVYLRKVGQMVELPSNVIQADEFAKILKAHQKETKEYFKKTYGVDIKRGIFFSFGTNDLTQTTMAADRDQSGLKHLFNESHQFVIESIRHVVNVAIENGIECGLCGQAIVNLVKTNPDAAEEILMMLGMTGGYAGTDYLGTEPTITRAASATLKASRITDVPADTEVLADGFESDLKRGAAPRPLFRVRDSADLSRTYLGDYVLLDASCKNIDLSDDTTKKIVESLGAVIYPMHVSDEMRRLEEQLKKLRVPVIHLGPSTEFKEVQDGEKITIDFTNMKIYKGELAIVVEVESKSSAIKVATQDRAPPQVEFATTLKASRFYTNKEGLNSLHPLNFVEYDESDESRDGLSKDAVHEIQELLAGTSSSTAKEAYKKYLISYLKMKMNHDKKNTHVYETNDLESDDFVAMRGSKAFIKDAEINPPLGFAGLDMLVRDKRFKELFKLEMEAVRALIDEGYSIAIQFNSVKIPENLTDALKILQDVGISPDKVRLGMNTAWPGNYLFTDQFIRAGHLSFIEIDYNKLTQGYLAAHVVDGKNQRVSDFYPHEMRPAYVARPEMMIKEAAYSADVAIRKSESFDEIFRKNRDEFRTAAKQLQRVSSGDKSKSPSAIVMYADDIISAGAVFDIKDVFGGHDKSGRKLLSGGRVILYTRGPADAENVTNLQKVIENADSSIKVTIVSTDDLEGALTDMKVMEQLKRKAEYFLRRDSQGRSGVAGEGKVLGIFRGPSGNLAQLASDANNLRVPVVVFEQIGFHSFAQALTKALQLGGAALPQSWILFLGPVQPISSERYQEFKLYVNQVLTKA